MKYWIFHNNQVLGPYAPDEMGKISVFSPESLVCPEGRRGTSMGDWQRAGMVPDLSVALVRASGNGGKTAVLSIAGLPPEPTLKDLAQLGSIQEKVAVLEEVMLQLQEGLRAKDAELSSVHQELEGKGRESDELKRQIAGLEDRLSSVRQLSETLDKAVEEEKRVEQDVEKQGQILTDLAKEIEELRRQLETTNTKQAALIDSPKANQAASAPAPFPVNAPSNFTQPPPPSMELPTPAASPVPVPVPQADTGAFDPMAFGDPNAGSLAPDAAPVPIAAPDPEPFGVVPPPPAPKGKKALVLGAVIGFAALGGLAVMGGYVPGLVKPKAPAEVLEPAPLPPPEPAPAPPPPDNRQLAVDFAKSWPLTGGRTLERALEDLAPSAGNLSPWMADPLMGARMQVNYFARSSAPGAPTIAYEFEVDLDGKTLVGRNAAAKSVLTGKAAAPPAPPKAKPVKVKPAVKKSPEEDSLDSMLGDGRSTSDSDETAPSDAGGTTLTDSGDAPLSDAGLSTPGEDAPKPARAKPGRRAAKAKAAKKEAPADEALLDDLLKE